jgi:hypothetical protein
MNLIQQSALVGTALSVYAHINPFATIVVIFVSSLIREEFINMTREISDYFD